MIHGAADLDRALAADRLVVLLSAPGAAGFAGCGFWRALVAAAPPSLVPVDILDCASAPGYALAALRAGQRWLVLDPACSGFPAVVAAAATLDAAVLSARPPALDLATGPSDAALLAWLSGDTSGPLG